jgi:D-inositol-3-phosphate glycosyltransferase
VKILLVSHYAVPHQGGIEFVVEQLSQRLSAHGYSVTHLASDAGSASGMIQDGNVLHIGVPAWDAVATYGIPFPIFHPVKLVRALKRALDGTDVVHIHGALYLSCVLAAWMARRRGIRVVLTEHVGLVEYDRRLVNLIEKFAFTTLGRFTCRQSDVITVLNQRITVELQPLKRSQTRIVKVSNGVDTALFKPASSSERETLRQKWNFTKPTVLFVGRLVYKKGVHLLTEVANAAFDLVFCGRGTLDTNHPSIRVLDPMPQSILVELYQAADVLVLPSEGEGFPLVVQEAMACGLPVIITDNAVNREYLDETVAIFTDRTPPDLLHEIQALLGDQTRQTRMGNAARQWAETHFDWERTVSAYEALYKDQ